MGPRRYPAFWCAGLKYALLICGAVALPVVLWAQLPKVAKQPPGSLEGEVVSAKGTPVAGAQVLWNSSDGETPHVLHSDAQGRFRIPKLRRGLYDLRASSDGKWSEWVHNVNVRAGSATNVTLRLAFAPPPPPAKVELKGTMRTWDVPVAGSVPHDPVVDLKGDIWFTLQETGQLARFSPDTQEWKLFKVPTQDSGPHGLVADPGGNIWFTENYVGKIGRWDARSGAITEYTPPSAKDPHSIAIGPGGELWFTAQNSSLIAKLNPVTGKISEFSVPTQNAHPYGIIAASDGGMWFCELTGRKLGRVDPMTGIIAEFAPPNSNIQPRRLVAAGDAIYFTDFGGGRMGRITLADKKFKLWDSPSGNDSEPYGIAADSTGKIWYEESAAKANKLVRFDPTVEVFAVYPIAAPNASVRNIALDAHGHLWMPLSLANKIMLVE